MNKDKVGLSVAIIQQYRQRFGGWLDRQAQTCVERGLRYVRLRTDRSLDSVMLEDLRRGGVLR